MSVGCNTVVVVAFEEPALFVALSGAYFLLRVLIFGRMLRSSFGLLDKKLFGGSSMPL
jgi:hypothetical protein